MVLENASSSAGPNTMADISPTSDQDPYSTNNNAVNGTKIVIKGADGLRTYYLDTGSLPRPIPIIHPLLSYTPKFFAKSLGERLQVSEKLIQRPLTQDEIQAIGYWQARRLSTASYGDPIGFIGGMYRCIETAGTFRFPFFQPDPDTMKRFIAMTASTGFGVRQWHVVRAISYSAMGIIVGQVLFASYGTTIATMGELGDARMKDFLQDYRAVMRKKLGSGMPAPRGADAKVDDASPTGGFFESEPEPVTEQRQPERTQQQPVVASRQPQSQPSSEQAGPTQSFDFFDDDASPTSGAGVQADTQTPSAPKRTTWQAIRRGQQQANGNSSWDQYRQAGSASTNSSDSFAYSKSEEERSLAKAEAQREFDARLEQERRGGDFAAPVERKKW